jgi:hypothetical protein
MKLINAFVAVVTALTLAGCYWMPEETQSGGISLTVSLPRGVLPPGSDTQAFRVYLYDAASVSALWGTPPMQPAPVDPYDNIEVFPSASPIPIEGYSYYDVDLGPAFDIYSTMSGSFVIPDMLPGRRYRIHMELGWYSAAPYFSGDIEGLSDAFEVPPGGIADVALDLYRSYNFFSYGGC